MVASSPSRRRKKAGGEDDCHPPPSSPSRRRKKAGGGDDCPSSPADKLKDKPQTSPSSNKRPRTHSAIVSKAITLLRTRLCGMSHPHLLLTDAQENKRQASFNCFNVGQVFSILPFSENQEQALVALVSHLLYGGKRFVTTLKCFALDQSTLGSSSFIYHLTV